jgi:hypothetical protein
VLETHYRALEQYLERARANICEADLLIPEKNRDIYTAETLPIKWFCHTAKTLGNIYEIFSLTGIFRQWIGSSEAVRDAGKAKYILRRFGEILSDERKNAADAVRIAEMDPRVETLFRNDHSFNGIRDMLNEKIALLDEQIDKVLPEMEALCLDDLLEIYSDRSYRPEGSRLDDR